METTSKKKLVIRIILWFIVIVVVAGFTLEYVRTKKVARDSIRIHNLKLVQYFLEDYFLENQTFPVAEGALTAEEGLTSCKIAWNELNQTLTANTGVLLPEDPGQNCTTKPYQYIYRSNGADYKVIATPEKCEWGTDKNILDPARPCTKESGNWAVYSDGAQNW
ncbi:MAG: hypothetical protein HOJ15_04350 [Candidatus Jacksonbacteria bacterium]|jgi:hypothetical protein|nr:hypothetical protein [Candidatus Jacksonbacteria bacterium]MBT6034105.1 hypothetical protein [Candidatus Jacksonbacteria bacterium]MBT6301630.1 hypothetical protein [Candidatus Jacksonbacteria bacterium]MBT6757225.1 hypothetical protein [Candidatus Jacksonbacteria bacterium]MBT6955491.1 hypothetical protein [Candidatus Jacksonbacteria bacterium]